jgi:two-component system, NtrC family, response regulator AtoC
LILQWLSDYSSEGLLLALGIKPAPQDAENMATVTFETHGMSEPTGFVSGRAASVQSLNALVAEIAKTNIPVLLVGESGTGKEIYARLIHRLSGLGENSLKKVSCASLEAAKLLGEIKEESHPRSAGLIGLARTVFLDAVHELDPACQRVLLSLLPDGEPGTLSGESPSRFISSTSRNLEKEVEAGRFRRELYFRINGVILRLPPLRERKEDIPALLDYFLAKHSNELNKDIPPITSDAHELITSYEWPGNIRELENLARKFVAVGNSAIALGDLRATHLGVSIPGERANATSLKVAARAASRRTERELILQALERTHWNRKRAARELQISYKSLLYKIKQIGMQSSEGGNP